MFEDVGIAFKQKNRTGVGVVVSIIIQSLILVILILIPLIYTEALPKAISNDFARCSASASASASASGDGENSQACQADSRPQGWWRPRSFLRKWPSSMKRRRT